MKLDADLDFVEIQDNCRPAAPWTALAQSGSRKTALASRRVRSVVGAPTYVSHHGTHAPAMREGKAHGTILKLVDATENSAPDQRPYRFSGQRPGQIARNQPVNNLHRLHQLRPRQQLQHNRLDRQRPQPHGDRFARPNVRNEPRVRMGLRIVRVNAVDILDQNDFRICPPAR